MTDSKLGTWRNPPLAYVVAELGISPYYSLQGVMPSLQDALRNAYPRTLEAQEIVLEGKLSSQPIWRFLSSDQGLGVQFGVRAISLHATSYVHSGDFLRRWVEVLDAIRTAKLGIFVERAGLRYVDLVLPSAKRSPADYLTPGLRGITPQGAKPAGSMWAASFQLDGSLINLRVAAPAPKGLILPPDLNALPLQKPAVMVRAEEYMKEDRPIGFIDTGCIREIQQVFDSTKIVDIFSGMQKLCSQTFRAGLSDIAEGEWV